MESKQEANLTPVPSKAGKNAVGHAPEAAPRVEITPRASAGRAHDFGVEGGAATWFRGILLRRRCDSCGTRINILGEVDDRVFMRCPECLREYVFIQRPE